MTDADRSMTAVVEFQIRTETTNMDEWLTEWHQRAEDALLGEPETSAYEAAVSTDDESCVLVFERYAHGSRSLQAHVERPAHAALTEAMGARNMTKRRVMSSRFYDVADYGWWTRSNDPLVQRDAIMVLAGMRFADAAQAEEFCRLTQTHADYCWEAEPDTLIYSGGIAAQDADRGLDIKQGDLVFVMACTDMDAVTRHRDDPRHLALGEQFAAAGIAVESTFAKTYRTTGRGFLSKVSAG